MSHWFIHSTNSLKKVLRLKSLTHSLGRSIQAHYSEKTWRKISKRIRTIGDSLYEWIIESFIQAIRSNLHTTTVCCSETQIVWRNWNYLRWWNESKQSILWCCAYNGSYSVFNSCLLKNCMKVQYLHSTQHFEQQHFYSCDIACVCYIQLDVCTNLWLRHECAVGGLSWVLCGFLLEH